MVLYWYRMDWNVWQDIGQIIPTKGHKGCSCCGGNFLPNIEKPYEKGAD
jgi:hypothetical protein